MASLLYSLTYATMENAVADICELTCIRVRLLASAPRLPSLVKGAGILATKIGRVILILLRVAVSLFALLLEGYRPSVCRQGYWDQWRRKLRESLAHLVG